MHRRYFLESAKVIRQVPGAKEVRGVSRSRQQLDEVGQAVRGDGLNGGAACRRSPLDNMRRLIVWKRGTSVSRNAYLPLERDALGVERPDRQKHCGETRRSSRLVECVLKGKGSRKIIVLTKRGNSGHETE